MYLGLILFVICAGVFVDGLEEGDLCILNSTGQRGICKTILSCPAALQEIKHQKFPQTCGFAGSVPRVCCVDETPPAKPITTTTTSSTTTPRAITTPKVDKNVYVNPYRPNEPGFKSYEKCSEYSRLVFTYAKPPISIIDKQAIKENTCGFRVVPSIVGGEPANRREFPHMALIGYNTEEGVQWLCGGTLISDSYVLTAGHCLISKEHGNASHVRLGVTEINNPGHRQDLGVIESVRYADYVPPSLYNDIALLRSEKKVEFNIYVRPACLHHARSSLGQKAIATGWGKTDFAGYTSDTSMKVTLGSADPVNCTDSFKRISQVRLDRGIDDERMFCAGSPGKDTCQGDSGGPSQIYSPIDCMYEIIGITSFGKPCGLGKNPGVYTRVSRYIDWLEKMVFT